MAAKAFSAYAPFPDRTHESAHGRSIRRRSPVMVPNSLGPGRPAHALPGPTSRNHATAPASPAERIFPALALTRCGGQARRRLRHDRSGRGAGTQIDGQTVLGISITCDKRYITLARVATLMSALPSACVTLTACWAARRISALPWCWCPADSPALIPGRRPICLADWPSRMGPGCAARMLFVQSTDTGRQGTRSGEGWKMLIGRARAAGRASPCLSMTLCRAAVAAYIIGHLCPYTPNSSACRTSACFEACANPPSAPHRPLTYMLDAARLMTTAGLDAGEKASPPWWSGHP